MTTDRRVWTDEEMQVLKDNYTKKTDKELMSLLPRRSVSSIKARRLRLGLGKNTSSPNKGEIDSIYGWDKEQDEFLKNNYNDMTDEDIGKAIGKIKQSVSQRRYKLGLRKYRNATSKRLSEQRNTLPKKQRIRVLLSAAYYVDQCKTTYANNCDCEHCKKAREISSIFEHPEKYKELERYLVKFK